MSQVSIARRRRRVRAALGIAIGALLATAGSAVAQSPSPGDVAVSPPPPSQPKRANGDTKYTTRLYGTTAFEKAVAVTQEVYPADGPTGVNTSTPDDRPRGLTLITPDDPLTGITVTPLIHFPDNAPVLFVTVTADKVGVREARSVRPRS